MPVVPLAGLAEADPTSSSNAPRPRCCATSPSRRWRPGRTLITLSCGALLDNFDLVDLARRHGGRILVPTGALLGLDAVQAAAQGEIARVHMITRKPPEGLDGAPYLVEHGISVIGIGSARCVFSGSAREAARGFPANVNVAAALALAGIGPDRTTIEIWADPDGGPQHPPHRGRGRHGAPPAARSRTCRASKTRRTGRLTPLSVVALLRKLGSPLAIGNLSRILWVNATKWRARLRPVLLYRYE